MRMFRQTCFVFTIFLPATIWAQQVPSTRDLNSMGLEVRWQGQAELDVDRDRVTFISNDESNVYIQSKTGILSAFDAENGRLLWANQVGRVNEPQQPATSNADLVILTAGPVIYGFNKFNGKSVIEHRMRKQPSAPATMTDGELYIPTADGTLYVYSLSTLQFKLKFGRLPDTVSRAFIWRFSVNERVRFAPVVGEEGVVFATDAGNLHAAAVRGQASGTTNYQIKLTSPVTAPLAIAPGTVDFDVLFAAGPKIVSADTTRGRINWEYSLDAPVTTLPVMIDDKIFVLTEKGTLVKMTRNTSSPDWGRPVTVARYDEPNLLGAGLEAVDVTDRQRQRMRISAQKALRVVSITPNSIADLSGLSVGDVIHSLDESPIGDVSAFTSLVTELSPRREHSVYAFGDDEVERRIRFRIPTDSWQANQVAQLCTVGRFSVFTVDSGNRLSAFDRETGDLKNRIQIPGFNRPLTNPVTDQLYLLSDTGRIVCLREIGPTITVPDLSEISQLAVLKKRSVAVGDRVTTGDTICVLSVDGTDFEVKTEVTGTLHGWFAKEGDTLAIGASIARISDDQFAKYYQNTDNQPLDISIVP